MSNPAGDFVLHNARFERAMLDVSRDLADAIARECNTDALTVRKVLAAVWDRVEPKIVERFESQPASDDCWPQI